jgi:hypothetical protein
MQINLATGWYSACQTPDYFNSCGASMVSVPSNWCGTQAARTGNAYGRILDYGYATNYREYMQIQLSSAMTAGVVYNVQYYVNLNDNASIAHNGPEVYFSSTAISTTTLFTYTPHIANATIITDKVGWTLISGTYTAVGGERYMTFGQYGNDASVPTASVAGGIWASASYYIEDVSVVPGVLSSAFEEFTAVPAPFTNELMVSMAQPHEGMLILERSDDGIQWTDMATIELSNSSNRYPFSDNNPSDATWYRARMEDASGAFTHSEVREVHRTSPGSKALTLLPNPVNGNGELQLLLPEGETLLSASVFDLRGAWVSDLDVASGSDNIPVGPLAPGLYLVQAVMTSNKRLSARLSVY